MRIKKLNPNKCLIPTCANLERVRGLCDACLTNAYKSIRRGEVTDPELVRAGLLLPKNPFRTALIELKAKQVKKEQS